MWPASQSGIYEDPGVKKERAEGETDRVEAKAVVAKHPASTDLPPVRRSRSRIGPRPPPCAYRRGSLILSFLRPSTRGLQLVQDVGGMHLTRQHRAEKMCRVTEHTKKIGQHRAAARQGPASLPTKPRPSPQAQVPWVVPSPPRPSPFRAVAYLDATTVRSCPQRHSLLKQGASGKYFTHPPPGLDYSTTRLPPGYGSAHAAVSSMSLRAV